MSKGKASSVSPKGALGRRRIRRGTGPVDEKQGRRASRKPKVLSEGERRERRSRLTARFIRKAGKEPHWVWRAYLKTRMWSAYDDEYHPAATTYCDYQLFAASQQKAEETLIRQGYAPPKGFDPDKLNVRWIDPPKKRLLN